MMACGLQGTAPLIILRAWISGLDRTQCIVLTAICVGLHQGNQFFYLSHLQTHWPVVAQLWTKLFMPLSYRKNMSLQAIDELVTELRYLQQPRQKTLTPVQLGDCLDKYFAVGKTGSS